MAQISIIWKSQLEGAMRVDAEYSITSRSICSWSSYSINQALILAPLEKNGKKTPDSPNQPLDRIHESV